MAQRVGLTVGFISGRPSKATARRAADLHVKIVMQKSSNKMDMVEKVKKTQPVQYRASILSDQLL